MNHFDIEAYFNTGEEENAILYSPSGIMTIKVHFYSKSDVMKIQNLDFIDANPMIECKTSDVENIGQNVKIKVRNQDWFTHEPEPDSDYTTKIFLSKD
jgi:hypothetical protein